MCYILGSVISIGDRKMKYTMGRSRSTTVNGVGNHVRHGFESPPPKPRRQHRSVNRRISPPSSSQHGIDLDLLHQIESPFEVGVIGIRQES